MSFYNSKEQLEEILKSSNIGLWKIEIEEGKAPRFYADLVMNELLGTPEDMTPEERYVFHRRHVLAEDYDLFDEYTKKLLTKDRTEIVYRYIHPKLGEMYVRCGGMRNPDEKNVISAEGTHQDITNTIRLEKDKIAEMRLYEKNIELEKEQHNTENFFEKLIQVQSCGVFAYQYPSYKIMALNNKIKELYGITSEMSSEEVIARIKDVYYDNEKETRKKLYQVLVNEGQIVRYGIQIPHDDGTMVHAIVTTQMIQGINGTRVIVSSVQDVSSLAEMQEANARLEEQLNIIRTLARTYYAIYYVDMSDYSFFEIGDGDASVQSVVGTKGNGIESFNEMLKYIVADDQIEEMRAFVDLTTMNERMKHTDILKKQYLDKIRGWFEGIFIAAKRDKDGNLENLIWAANCINDTKEQEVEYQKALMNATMKAKAANDAKTSFLFNMSHDIRTPMNAIIGYTNLLKKHPEDAEKCLDYISKIQSSSDFLLSLINNVLEKARIESGKTALDETTVECEQVIHEIYSVYSGLMKEKHLNFTLDTDLNTKYILADKVKLNEIYLNLISNAYKYTPEGGRITFSVQELPSENEGYATIVGKVSDTGIGMAQEYLPHIFEEFTREHSATEAGVQGTGLGMPIVKKLVDMMGGTITVESTLGKGSTFTVTVPFKIAEAPASTLPSETDEHPDFSGKRILLAEDNNLNAEIAEEILSEFGLAVDRAADGVICVDMIQKAKVNYYDLILMDIQMPNLNGYEATKLIRSMTSKKKSSIPIIAMTANAFEEDRKNALAAGMNGHLSKPIEIPKLLGILSEYLK